METIQQPDSSGPLGRGRRLQWGTALSGESVEFRIWAPEREEVQVEIVDDELRVIRLLP